MKKPKVEVNSPKGEVSNLKFEVNNPKVEVGSLKLKVSNLKFEVSNPKVEVHSLKVEMSNLKFEVCTPAKNLVKLTKGFNRLTYGNEDLKQGGCKETNIRPVCVDAEPKIIIGK